MSARESHDFSRGRDVKLPQWPLFDLVVRTPRLELREPTDADLGALADLVAAGIHDPAEMPFSQPWTDVEPPALQRRSLQHWWSKRAQWRPDNWDFTGAVFVDGRVVGVQNAFAHNFSELGAVKTGSWLGRQFQGQGLGKEMRAAILHLLFAGLGARVAYSGAWHDNERSMRVSQSFGYEENGVTIELRRGQPDRMINLRLERDRWESGRRDDITIEGLEACLPFFTGPGW
jgi:RimJ/RimL family protein N-acetyltransferase